MKTSPSGLAFIARQEGEVDHIYIDQAGKRTIGVGHLIKAGENIENQITHEEALAILAGDTAIAESAVNLGCYAAASGTLSQNAFDACVSFTFNCGGGAFAQSSVRRLLNAGDMAGAAAGFELWDKRKDPATGALVVDGGLLKRRQAERDLFLTPDDDNPY